MEQIPSWVEHTITIVKNALQHVNDVRHHVISLNHMISLLQSGFQSLLFKQYLQHGQYEDAYNAMVTISDSSR